ncbi:MAG: hypothetical protein OHK0031_06790 [Anaerolineales bacterium]
MQTCTRCNATSPDSAKECVHCHANLAEFSATSVSLTQLQKNPRVTAIRINVAGDACPLCYESRGTFSKETVPALPHEGCSHQHGCRCNYEPVLSEIYP